MAENNGEKTEKVERSQSELVEEYRQVAGDVAHDLNNLLFLISGYTEILARSLDDHEQVLEVVHNIQVATSGVKELTQKLQTIAQIESVETIGSVARHGEPPDEKIAHRNDVKIVVAIRDEELRKLVSRVLDRGNFGIDEIEVGDNTFFSKRRSDDQFDVLITEAETSKGDGGEFVAGILRTFPRISLLLLTDADDEGIELAKAHTTFSLPKSFRPSELVDALEQLLAQ